MMPGWGVALPLEQRAQGLVALFEYMQDHIQDHIEHPRDDLISLLLDSELDGEKLSPFHVARTVTLLRRESAYQSAAARAFIHLTQQLVHARGYTPPDSDPVPGSWV